MLTSQRIVPTQTPSSSSSCPPSLLFYSATAIKESLFDDSLSDTLCNISGMTGPHWCTLILAWSKPFADAVLASPDAANILPALNKDQQWEENAFIKSKGLTDDKEED